jgi:DNA-binding NarL/FixJ family response regulator
MPIRYQTTKNRIQRIDRMTAYGSISETTVPMPAPFRYLLAKLTRGDHVIGVFGQVSDLVEEPQPHPELHLTPRQAEVLRLLERGRTTTQIAEELHLSRETVRNHVRHLLHAVGAHSRLEAVAIARGEAIA